MFRRSTVRVGQRQANIDSREGRLARRYLVFILSLVSIALIGNSILAAYSFYNQNQSLLLGVQREKGIAAAQAIDRFMVSVVQQLAWAMPAGRRDLPGGLDERLDDYHRLLRQAPAITSATYVDSAGLAQIQVSRVGRTIVGSHDNFANDLSFQRATPSEPYFGPVYFLRDSEPHMTVAIAEGNTGGVTIADVNLKLVLDVVTQLRFGRAGHAYVVDEHGVLVAHPEIGLVLRRTDVSHLSSVQAALRGKTQPLHDNVIIDKGLGSDVVVTSYELTSQAPLVVLVEQPLSEALLPLYGTLQWAVGFLLLTLGLAVAGSFSLARRMTNPIRDLGAGAARLGAGDLDKRIEVHTGDELETLADEFNRMADHLQDLYMGLERRVSERTAELASALHELEAKTRELEVASRHKSEFLANMSHELRTPLNSVIGFSDVLLQQMFGQLNEKQTEYVRDVRASGQHLLSLINDILDLSKVEAGHMELELSEFWLPEVLENTLSMFRETATRRGISLRIDVSTELGVIRADLRRVRQILFNLLSNAIKFTEAGAVELQATRDGEVARIAISDTGIGISPSDQVRVFEAFQQSSSSRRLPEGTGLGLSLVRRLVELHGGTITVASDLGRGSTFTFTLPLLHSPGSFRENEDTPTGEDAQQTISART